MTITSLSFLLFLVITVMVYFAAPARIRWFVLLAASWVFYLFSGAANLLFLVFASANTFFAGLILGRLDTRGKKRAVLIICLALNFGILVVFKFSAQMSALIGGLFPAFSAWQTGILLPLGISFYMFQSAGYVIDVYRGKYPPDRNFLKFSLFVSYFPQLIQGPIGRYDRLAQQLYAPNTWDDTRAKYGIQLALWGLFKKLVIADRAAALVGEVFGNYGNYGGAVIFVSVLVYSVQIYADFSGGIDIVRGISQILGIELDENFKRPFFASSISDFWRRWHITLGTWLKDYLFYPLTLSKPLSLIGRKTRKAFGNNVGKLVPVTVATFFTYIVVGLWHGGGFSFIAFGLYNGGLIILSRIFEPQFSRIRKRLGITDENRAWHAFRVTRTLCLVVIARYFSRAPSFMTALGMLKRTFTNPAAGQLTDGTLLKLGIDTTGFIILLVAVFAVFAVDFLQERGVQIRRTLETKSAWAQWGVLMLLLAAIFFCGGVFSDTAASLGFIYGQY